MVANEQTVSAWRIMGLDATTARRMAGQLAASPAWLFAVSSEEARQASMRHVPLDAGPATLLQDVDEAGAVTLVWGVPDRVYVLTTRAGEKRVSIANSMR